MSEQARIDYTNAVRCLQAKPAVNSKSDVPGARSHYDDFCATHIIQANFVHFDVRTVRLLPRRPPQGI